ncbi:O-acyltransferase like protein-like isoform X2 [Toxorhynchites rutilus septentrionalis]|uniref:O-acyltransferase like protein-like isoform X2 n=1 Tax=Toxorhynchites rutilus septentrionalis TaxID=329112 RepID=UPI002478F3B7|nr:O-acyltransferase like protein-like isoform X2 [Toxorhynchites rutilus septentrionalis]
MMSRYISSATAIVAFVLVVKVRCDVLTPSDVWKQLPDLYEYDDFEDCRRGNPNYLYCVVKAHIKENSSSVVWKQISQYSSDPRHYRRDILELGICLDRCHPSTETGNQTELVKRCATDRVRLRYQLTSSARIWNCASLDTFNQPIGRILETIFILTCAVILLTVVTSTAVDLGWIQFKKNVITNSFSLSRNLDKFGALNHRSRQDLMFLDGIRAITMMVILLCHASIPMIRFPLKNPESIEQQFDNFWFPIAMSGNTYTVQMFFILGGVMVAISVLDHMKNHPELKLAFLWERIMNRLIRLLPVYAFVILFQASWYQRLQDGPIAYRYKDHCRENWWTNLLFVNNYIRANEPCTQFTWYLGADFQLFLLGTVIMMLIWRFPSFTRHIMVVMVAFALIVPAAVIYVYKLDATVMMIVRYVINEIRDLEYYLRVYITFESNAGNYFFGMIAGIVCHNISENAKKLNSVKNLKSMLLLATTFFIVMNTMTVLLPRDQLNEHSLQLALFGSLLKSSWGILAAYIILYLKLRPQSLVVSLLRHPVMLVTAKLSYCVYVVQYSVVYAIYRNVTAPLMSNAYTTILFTSSILFITFLVSFLLHVCIEMPCMSLFKDLLNRSKQWKAHSAPSKQHSAPCEGLFESKEIDSKATCN